MLTDEQQKELARTLASGQEPTLQLWTVDGHRVALQPIVWRVWARKGQRPLVEVRPRYEWLYVYGFVCPESGETDFWLAPAVESVAFRMITEAFMCERTAPVLLVLDQAGWHVSEQVQALEENHSLELMYLPGGSPELQPAERLWELCDEPLVNKVFEDLQDLEAALAERCVRPSSNLLATRYQVTLDFSPKVQFLGRDLR